MFMQNSYIVRHMNINAILGNTSWNSYFRCNIREPNRICLVSIQAKIFSHKIAYVYDVKAYIKHIK